MSEKGRGTRADKLWAAWLAEEDAILAKLEADPEARITAAEIAIVSFYAGYEAAVAAERERIIAALETQIQIASYGGSSYRETARSVLERAIEIVKGGDER